MKTLSSTNGDSKKMLKSLILNKNYRTLLIAYLFSTFMMVLLHAALTTITNRNLEQAGKILASQIEENIFFKDNLNLPDSMIKFVKNYPAARISFYDHEGKKIISTNDTEIRNIFDFHVMDFFAMQFLPENNYRLVDALKGNQYSEIIWSASFNNDDQHHTFIKVVTPISSRTLNNSNKNLGAIEIFFDVTAEWKKYDNTRYFGILLISIIFFIFYVIIQRIEKKEN